jgi:hypothetical protein
MGLETVILVIPSQESIVVNESGSFVWESIDGALTVAHLAKKLAEDYEVELAQAQADVETLIAELYAKGAVTFNHAV